MNETGLFTLWEGFEGSADGESGEGHPAHQRHQLAAIANTEAERKLKDDVTEAQKTARIVRINTLQADISLQKNKFVVGRIQSVMIESSRDIKGGALYGRNDANKIVVLPQGAASPGDIMNVRIIRATPHQLKGEVVDSL